MKLHANPFMQARQPMQLTLHGDADLLDVIELSLEDRVHALSRPVDPIAPQLVILFDDSVHAMVHACVARAVEMLGFQAPSMHEVRMQDINWAEQVQKDFPAFRVKRFYVFGSHVEGAQPVNTLPLHIDAAAAFGTGEHATTAGCLLALLRVKKTMPHAKRIVDMGCGTAILAIAAKHVWPSAQLSAYDNDPVAVKVAAHNVRVNHVRMPCGVSDGYRMQRVKRGGPYDIIIANILARPLMRMAWAAAQQLAPNGVLMVSGLLLSQVRMVVHAHQAQGLRVQAVLPSGRWAVVLFRR
jgi:ribosomal protein L11 methyltransferase